MIRRTSSKQTDSLVNTAHEEHLNVSGAIRDDAPITNLTTVVKSINFDADGDGAYILRKPLLKKTSIPWNANSKTFLLWDGVTKLKITNTYIENSEHLSMKIKFNDVDLREHVIKYSSSVFSNIQAYWLTLKDVLNTSEFTLLSVEIDHAKFKQAYQQRKLTNDTSLNILKRFIKVYMEDDYLTLEIVHPELNSITSSLDVGNANTLDINLLADNPYAIRDLYDYGYISATKIIPYVSTEDLSKEAIEAKQVYALTESLNEFKILAGTNRNRFTNHCIVLKAFLTTAVKPNIKYYCCWEFSKDDGINWSECPEFVNNPALKHVEGGKLVTDLTAEEFKNISDTDLEDPESYLITRHVAELKVYVASVGSYQNSFHTSDQLRFRPDVLILENPNLDYKYRFRIFIETDAPDKVNKHKTKLVTMSSFNALEGVVPGTDNLIKFKTYNMGVSSSAAPELIGSNLWLPNAELKDPYEDPYSSGGFTNTSFKRDPGAMLSVYTDDSTCRITSVSFITVVPDTTSKGSFFGITQDIDETDLNLDANNNVWNLLEINERTILANQYPYSYRTKVQTYDCSNLFRGSGSTIKYLTDTSKGDGKRINLANLSACAFNYNPTTFSRYVQDDGYNTNEQSYTKIFPDGTITNNAVKLYISGIVVEYEYDLEEDISNTYMASSTGTFSFPYNGYKTELVEDLSKEHDAIFSGKLFYAESQKQILAYNKDKVYVSGVNSTIMRLMNGLSLPEDITKVIQWRGYILIFTKRSVYLARYDIATDAYNIRLLVNTVGVSEIDAGTIVPILNSIYFKSGTKLYRLTPNLYAASDDILNIKQISIGINKILEDLFVKYRESHNFAYADADVYSVFIPVSEVTGEGVTYCITFDFNRSVWTLHKYPVKFTDIEKVSATEIYLKDNSNLYLFREGFLKILTDGVIKANPNTLVTSTEVENLLRAVPYADYPQLDTKELVEMFQDNFASGNYNFLEGDNSPMVPIDFYIDFGQKSSNYTIGKQFLETKYTLATLLPKENIPLDLDIYADGNDVLDSRMHWDSNTDAAIQKESLDTIGVLNANFSSQGADYNGIFKQLIVKYACKGKSTRHVIQGKSRTLFKFYSMDIRSRILPKKK